MENLTTVGVHLILSLAGLLIYSLMQVAKHLKTFSFKKFYNENKPFWVWAFALQFIFALLVTFIPDTAEALEKITTMDFSQPMAFLWSGIGLAKLANWTTGKTVSESSKIGKKPII